MRINGTIGRWLPLDDPELEDETLFEREPTGTVILDLEGWARIFHEPNAAIAWRVQHGGDGPYTIHDCAEGRRARAEARS